MSCLYVFCVAVLRVRGGHLVRVGLLHQVQVVAGRHSSSRGQAHDAQLRSLLNAYARRDAMVRIRIKGPTRLVRLQSSECSLPSPLKIIYTGRIKNIHLVPFVHH